MASRTEIDSEAAAEAVSARQWYEARSPKAAAAFVEELEGAIECIVESPFRYRLYVAGTRRYLMHRFPFFIVYCFDVNADLIQIVAVAHAKRRPGYWRHR